MNLSVTPYPRFKAFYPASGTPLSGGFLYTAAPGTTVQYGFPPAYPQATYTDSTGMTANSNPVVLDANGEADVWLSTFTKLVLFDMNGNLVWSKDNVSSSPALTPSSLQWVPQSSQVSFVSSTQFSVPGNLTGIFPPGTAVQATITGGNIYGIVQSSSYGGTPGITTVTVSWFSTALNSSVTAVAAGILTPQGVGSGMPLLPPVTLPSTGGTYTMTYASLFQIFIVPSNLGAALTIALPSASSVPPGAWLRIRNTNTGINAYSVQFSNTIDGQTSPVYMLGLDWQLFSDGTNWHATIAPAQVVNLAYSANNLLSGGTATTWASLDASGTGITLLNTLIPAAARAIFGFANMNTGGIGYLAPAATLTGALSTGSGVVAIGALTATPFRTALMQPQLVYYLVTADNMNVTLCGYEI
jgi:hypothetical protein